MRVVGYVRVSTADQQDNGNSLDAQKQAIGRECQRRGWRLADLAGDTASAKTMRKRPGFERVLEQLDEGEYEALMVLRLDRAWRSVGDFAQTMDRAQKHGWLIVMVDTPVDMSTPLGRAMAGVAAVFAQLERELISQRTREGMAAARAAGKWEPPKPQVVGRVVERMVALRASREPPMPYRKIAAALMLEGFRPPRGGVWQASTVQKALRRTET